MLVKQLSVFIENRKGRLAQFSKLLGENSIDMLAISIADTTDFGILRTIVNDHEKALKIVKAAGYTVSGTEVLAVGVPDVPGGMSKVLELLHQSDINVEYVYSFCRHIHGDAYIIVRVDRTEDAVKLLQQNRIKMLSQNEITNM